MPWSVDAFRDSLVVTAQDEDRARRHELVFHLVVVPDYFGEGKSKSVHGFVLEGGSELFLCPFSVPLRLFC